MSFSYAKNFIGSENLPVPLNLVGSENLLASNQFARLEGWVSMLDLVHPNQKPNC